MLGFFAGRIQIQLSILDKQDSLRSWERTWGFRWKTSKTIFLLEYSFYQDMLRYESQRYSELDPAWPPSNLPLQCDYKCKFYENNGGKKTLGNLWLLKRNFKITVIKKLGFNIENKTEYDVNGYMNLRIGFVANNQNDCLSCDSCIGFGISVQGCDGDVRSTTCGHMAICDKFGNPGTAGFGYIFVQ